MKNQKYILAFDTANESISIAIGLLDFKKKKIDKLCKNLRIINQKIKNKEIRTYIKNMKIEILWNSIPQNIDFLNFVE